MPDVPFETISTYEYVRRSLPGGCRRVLEVGSGTGELAARLMRDGLEVVAVDSDPDAVAAARGRGVDARVAQWSQSPNEQFGAVLFARSLHHIHPLTKSVNAAVACLAPGGRLVVEDFAVEAADRRTLAWFTGAVRMLRESGLLSGRNARLENLLSAGDALAAWREYHDHDLHQATTMAAELGRALADVTIEAAPYLFRYVGAAMAHAPERDARLHALAEQEAELIADGAITALGWQLSGAVGAG